MKEGRAPSFTPSLFFLRWVWRRSAALEKSPKPAAVRGRLGLLPGQYVFSSFCAPLHPPPQTCCCWMRREETSCMGFSEGCGGCVLDGRKRGRCAWGIGTVVVFWLNLWSRNGPQAQQGKRCEGCCLSMERDVAVGEGEWGLCWGASPGQQTGAFSAFQQGDRGRLGVNESPL